MGAVHWLETVWWGKSRILWTLVGNIGLIMRIKSNEFLLVSIMFSSD